MDIQKLKAIKEQTDIVAVVSHFLPLKKNGVNFQGNCPFHAEKSSSLTVNTQRGIFKCFGCGKGGDVFDFLQMHRGMDKHAAAVWVSEFMNVKIDPEYKYEPAVELPTSYVPYSLYERSMFTNHENYFIKWLNKLYKKETVNEICKKYNIGTSKFWRGACVFWQLDVEGKIRSGKIMVYNSVTGKRVKHPKPLITWVHKAAKLPDFNVNVCLFGEHLLKEYPDKEVFIVESEKTAIIASVFYRHGVWLASGSLTNLSYKRCKVLEGRTINLLPDVGAEDRWREKLNELSELIPGTWKLRPLIGDYPKGYDLCDYLIN